MVMVKILKDVMIVADRGQDGKMEITQLEQQKKKRLEQFKGPQTTSNVSILAL